jgi:uncharacterized damage-inducible protein DinB
MSALPEPALPEPWMRGPVEGVSVLAAPVLYAFQQAREELRQYTEGLTVEQLWARPFGFGSVGFHLLHIAGSTDRLIAYLQGCELSAAQFAALEREPHAGGQSRDELLVELDRAFAQAEAVVRGIDPATLADARAVGRRKLPATVIGLLTHIAEHTQRHTGQAIAAAKLARVCNNVR